MAGSVKQQGQEGGGDASRAEVAVQCRKEQFQLATSMAQPFQCVESSQLCTVLGLLLHLFVHNNVLYKHPWDVPHLAATLGCREWGLNFQEERLRGTAGLKLSVAQENGKLTSAPCTFGI